MSLLKKKKSSEPYRTKMKTTFSNSIQYDISLIEF